MDFAPFTIICGHYGTGKTNLSLNIALHIAKQGHSVILADLDIVNPYFRSSDYHELLDSYGIRLIAPGFAGSTLDAPALPAELNALFDCNNNSHIIIDLGGDDAGARALGRFAPNLRCLDYEMLYVVNKFRPLINNSDDAVSLLREIEAASRLRSDAVVNNSHLMGDTSANTVRLSVGYAREIAERLELPLKFSAAPRSIAHDLHDLSIFPLDILVHAPWY